MPFALDVKDTTTVLPEVLALTDYPQFAQILGNIKRGRHPSIYAGSPDHRRLQKIAAYCINQSPTNTNLKCMQCNGPALYVGCINQGDILIVTPEELYCGKHTPNPSSRRVIIKITLGCSFGQKGRFRRDLQKLARQAFNVPQRVTPEAAKEFFANLEEQAPQVPGNLWYLD